MQISDVEAFLEVVKYKSFSTAARKLYISQAAVSMRVKSLENESGIQLLYREKNQVRLTRAGQAFLPWAQEIIAAEKNARAAMELFSQGTRGTLTIAASATVCGWLLPRIFKKVYDSYPQVEILFRTCFTDEIIERVAGGDVQFGIIRGDFPSLADERFSCKLLSKDRIYFAAHSGHNIFGKEKITLETISKTPLIVYASGADYWPHIKKIFDAKNLHPDVAFHVNDISAVKILTNLGTHICCLSEVSLRCPAEGESLRIIPVEDYEPVVRYSMLIYRRDANMTRVMKEFMTLADSFETPEPPVSMLGDSVGGPDNPGKQPK